MVQCKHEVCSSLVLLQNGRHRISFTTNVAQSLHVVKPNYWQYNWLYIPYYNRDIQCNQSLNPVASSPVYPYIVLRYVYEKLGLRTRLF